MKKGLVILFLVLISAISCSAQILKFRTTSFTSKEHTSYGWTNWQRYQRSDMLVEMDFNNDIVTIYSPRRQYYKIISYNGTYTDSDGDTTASFDFVDQDNDYGSMRLVQRRNGKSEIYIDFSNIMWVYSVIRI